MTSPSQYSSNRTIREITSPQIAVWLESIERALQAAKGIQYEEIEKGHLALWISEANGETTLHLLDQELTREFRHHDGVRWEILEAHDDGRLSPLKGGENSTIHYRAARP